MVVMIFGEPPAFDSLMDTLARCNVVDFKKRLAGKKAENRN